MFTTIRKHQRWLMLVIAVLTVIAFAFLYNTTEMDRVGSNIVAKIYGRDVMTVDIERSFRNYQLALALGQFDLVRDLSGQARTEEEAANNFIWNLMILQHEAARLGVEPAQELVLERIKGLPVFQTDGQFDPRTYATFMQEQLAPRGFTEMQLESVIKDSLRLAAIKQLVESPAVLLPGEVDEALQRTRPLDLDVLTWSAAGRPVEVSDEELQEVFAARSAQLTTPERRAVRYVQFELTREERELAGRERVGALQRVASATGDFAQALADGAADLAGAAQAAEVEVRTTPLFAADGSTEGALADADGEVVPAAAAVAFRLSEGDGQYEIIPLGETGYAIIEVAAVEPVRPLTFEEARADLRAELITSKREEAVRTAAGEALAGIRATMGEGASFAEAVKAAALKPEEMKGLSVFDQELTPEQRQKAGAAMDLADGAVSDFFPTADGGFAVHLAARGEPDEETVGEQRPMIEQGMLQGKQMLLFAQWLATARDEAGLQILRPMM
jgi:peptidyl-prolyl cis-trans isomerase D